jgi:hypothetical protein
MPGSGIGTNSLRLIAAPQDAAPSSDGSAWPLNFQTYLVRFVSTCVLLVGATASAVPHGALFSTAPNKNRGIEPYRKSVPQGGDAVSDFRLLAALGQKDRTEQSKTRANKTTAHPAVEC